MSRTILHVDLNSFYASVELIHRPELRDKPVAVCGDAEARHGIVLAKSEMAKKAGVKTGDVIWEARQTIDSIRKRFGHYSVQRCAMLLDRQLTGFNRKMIIPFILYLILSRGELCGESTHRSSSQTR